MAQGNEQFEELVRLHGPALFRTAVLLAGDRDNGQDLLHDALERVLRRAPGGGVEFPAAYVRTTMVRLVQRRRLDRVLHGAALNAQAHPASATSFDGVDQRDVLLPALRRLPPRQRSAVVLRYWEGCSEAEAAEILRCSVGTVKSQASRGLAKLRVSCATAFPERGAAPTRLISATTGEPT
ncbi:SigE family RNA polymerase sigma factor [Pengzhenrongella phosphoraccumulans]|uniref:SigE family RNA polymerase sigma factor n=1 Tax=Pengzhenrongella phosphoraccumulans TaxID=3114394 RepID=UPI00388D8C2E